MQIYLLPKFGDVKLSKAMEITKRNFFSFIKYVSQFFVGLTLLLVTLYGPNNIHLPYIKDTNALFQIAVILFLVYTAIEVVENLLEGTAFYRRKQLYNLCVRLFDHYFREEEEMQGQKDIYRITVFGLRRKLFFFGPKRLHYVTRYQHGASEDNPRIVFKPGEGAAGQAYLSNTVIFQPSLPDYSQAPQNYIRLSKERYNLDEEKVKALNRHARSYICFPMRGVEIGGKPRAIVSIDCLLPDVFYENKHFQDNMLPDIMKSIDCSSAEVF